VRTGVVAMARGSSAVTDASANSNGRQPAAVLSA